MTSRSPSAMLAGALKPYDTSAIAKLARGCGVKPEQARRARNGGKAYAAPVEVHIRLCDALAVDPVTGVAVSRRQAQEFPKWFAGLGIRGHRFRRGHSMRQAAKIMGISSTTLSRIETGGDYSFNAFNAACSYAGVHPDSFRANVACETSARNTLSEKDKSISAVAS